MMIVGARSYWSIIKLLVCMLVFFLYWHNTYAQFDSNQTIDCNWIQMTAAECMQKWNNPCWWWQKTCGWSCIPSSQTCYDQKTAEESQKAYEQSDAWKLAKCQKTYWTGWYCDCKLTLKWIYLNTEVPFVWAPGNPRCLVLDGTWWWATTVLQSLTKILMTFVMIGGFGMIVWWGVQIAAGDVKWGKEKIIWVVIAFALLWSLWVILRFINPNFFS